MASISNRQGGVTHTPAPGKEKFAKGSADHKDLQKIYNHPKQPKLGEDYTMDDALELLHPAQVAGNPDFPQGQDMQYNDAPDQANSTANDIKDTDGYAPRPHVEGTNTVKTDVAPRRPQSAVVGENGLAKPTDHKKPVKLGDTLSMGKSK